MPHPLSYLRQPITFKQTIKLHDGTKINVKTPWYFLAGLNKPFDSGKRRTKKTRFGTPKATGAKQL
jgi:hypothetical protein